MLLSVCFYENLNRIYNKMFLFFIYMYLKNFVKIVVIYYKVLFCFFV